MENKAENDWVKHVKPFEVEGVVLVGTPGKTWHEGLGKDLESKGNNRQDAQNCVAWQADKYWPMKIWNQLFKIIKVTIQLFVMLLWYKCIIQRQYVIVALL